MSLSTIARACAVPVSLWLMAALAFDPGYRADNIFAVPDFTFSLLLLIAAFLPWRIALPSLTAGYFFGSGVITIAAFDRFHEGQPIQGAIDSVIAAIYLSVASLLILRTVRTRTPAARSCGNRALPPWTSRDHVLR
ncbi:hypothetical protein ACRS6B_20970 [Nocardia asteroides]